MKTTSNKNGRQPPKKMEDNFKKIKMEDDLKNNNRKQPLKNGRRPQKINKN